MNMNDLTRIQIKKLQSNMPLIRKIMGWSAVELADKIGVTKQTVSNLERSKTAMTTTQYIAIRAVLDYEISKRKDRVPVKEILTFLLEYNAFLRFDQRETDRTMACILDALDKNTDNKTIARIIRNMLGKSSINIEIAIAQELTNKTPSPWLENIIG